MCYEKDRSWRIFNNSKPVIYHGQQKSWKQIDGWTVVNRKNKKLRSMIDENVRDKALESEDNLVKFFEKAIVLWHCSNQSHLPPSSVPKCSIASNDEEIQPNLFINQLVYFELTHFPPLPWCPFFCHQEQQLSVWSIQKLTEVDVGKRICWWFQSILKCM